MEELARFIFELGQQRRIKNEGLRMALVDNPPSIAEHSLRAAQIGYLLARMEGADPATVCSILIFHDIGECRTGDLHKVARRYCAPDEARAVREQLAPLGDTGNDISHLWTACDGREGKEGIVAKDADYLEHAFTAKEFVERGHAEAQDWIDNVGKALKTACAKRLFEAMQKTKATAWWHGLKKLE